jgi:protein farnesyltransferase subunit beta
MESNSPLKFIGRTDKDQKIAEEAISKIYLLEGLKIKNLENFEKDIIFNYEYHLEFAKKMIRCMPGSYSFIDAGLPWFSYWVLNIFEICGLNKYELSLELKLKFISYLRELQHEDGGFCGYSKGMPHLVSNYAAVMAIINLSIPEAFDLIDRGKMKRFLKKMKINNKQSHKLKDSIDGFLIEKLENNNCSEYRVSWPGSFQMHENGESDLRASYCALTVAYILDILDDELIDGVVENIQRCQTFEGGLGPEPYNEAHGGYSFCGISTLVLLNKLESIDIKRFLLWLVNKQMTVEGGFQGRTNKLVDSCYSFWQGSIFNIIAMSNQNYTYENELLYNQLALQGYILYCCQSPSGGLYDKPGKPADLFHTNYASAGLALSQKCFLSDEYEELKVSLSYSDSVDFKEIDPIFCVPKEKLLYAKNYFRSKSN